MKKITAFFLLFGFVLASLLSAGALEETEKEKTVLVPVPYVYQSDKYPNGCEAVSTVMALRKAGMLLSPEDFIENYLPMGAKPRRGFFGPDTDEVYAGDPRLDSGWGCNAPVILKALAACTDPEKMTAADLTGTSLEDLCSGYLDRGIPVVIWATLYMIDASKPEQQTHWIAPGGKEILYNTYQHCVLLVGYEEDCFYINDPLRFQTVNMPYTVYSREAVEIAYELLGKQAVAVWRNDPDNTEPIRPREPDLPIDSPMRLTNYERPLPAGGENASKRKTALSGFQPRFRKPFSPTRTPEMLPADSGKDGK